MLTTVIRPCKCLNTYQDARYGRGNRVHNTGKSIDKGVTYICTVCGMKK